MVIGRLYLLYVSMYCYLVLNLDKALKLTDAAVKHDKIKKNKIHSLLISLTSSFINKEELIRILEDNAMVLENNLAVQVLTERGFAEGLEQGIEQGIILTAKKMFLRGDDIEEISDITGFSIAELRSLRLDMQN